MGAETAVTAPWDSVPAHEQLFVLITGANSGVGLGTAQRLIDEFLATRSLDSHLVLLPTTRSASKSLHTIREIRSYAQRAAQTNARGGESWQRTVGRIHVLSLTVDLCDLRSVRRLADKLTNGTVGNPPGLEGEYLNRVRVPRLDSVVCNAAFGGWTGVDYPAAVWSMLTKGLLQSVTWPTFKNALPTCILNERESLGYPAAPLLGEVFTACVFGHYMLAHQLLPLLSRSQSSPVAPGRIIWSSSLEAVADVFTPDDLQGFNRPAAYESAKRLTDILALTYSLPSVRPLSSRWAAVADGDEKEKRKGKAKEKERLVVAPKMYVTHPGIVASTLFPVPWFLFWAYELTLVLSRWLGSPWHTVDGYTGAKAAVWVALEDQDALDSSHADRIKWGSTSDRRLRVDVKPTEVEGWGWQGKVEDPEADTALGVLHKTKGRKNGAAQVMEEDIVRFEELGTRCWKAMEELRGTWEDIVKKDG
ncbi:hypothetical protein RJ55_00842 [Drechmeria coniospora]|nr:hypothetical protein RJ55_00842 [Drechmeria coniospora]